MIQLTEQQMNAAERGEAVEVRTNGRSYVLLSRHRFNELDQVDTTPWTVEEMNLLADEAAEIIAAGEAAQKPQIP